MWSELAPSRPISAIALRCQSPSDRNEALLEYIVILAQRHRRYDACMIYLVLRQASEQLNHKHVKCPYTVIRLQVTRRNCKKPPLSERKPLDRLGAANHV